MAVHLAVAGDVFDGVLFLRIFIPILPSLWKQASVSPTHNKNDSDFSKFKPISPLSTTGRSFEEIIKDENKGYDLELIQSNPTSRPQNQKGKKHRYKLINVHERHAQ